MSKYAVVFWSGTGNTEEMANQLASGISAAGAQAEVFDCADFSASEAHNYAGFAFGCPACGDEELDETEFRPCWEECLPHLTETQTPVVLFGSYAWNEGEWMETWEAEAREAGVQVLETIICESSIEEEDTAELLRVGALLARSTS